MKNFTMFNNLATRDAGREHTSAARYTASFTPDIDSKTDRKRLDNGSITVRIWKYAAMLLMVMTFGVGEMDALDASSANIYYDNTSSAWSDVQIFIGHSGWSVADAMTKLTNSNNLYYKRSYSWGGYSSFYFTTGASGWDGRSENVDTRVGYTTHYSAKMTDNLSNSTWLFVSSGSSNGSSVSASTITGYDKLNYTQTVQQTLSTDGGSTYSASTASLATVSVSSYYLSSATSTSATASSGTISAGNSSSTCKAVRTATVTYSVSSVTSGYTFVGWYDGSTEKSTSTTYTYNATEAKTITARFKAEETHNVNVYYKYGSVTVKTATTESAVGVSTARSFTAPEIDGYNFFSYTFGNGLTMKSASTTTNPCSFVTKGSGTYELTVNYNIAPVKLLYGSATPLNSPSNTTMTYDAYNKVHYVDVTTNSSPYYFRFDYNTNTQEYGGAWDTYPNVVEATANGAKVACEEEVKGWDNKSSVKFTGANGSAIRIYFDYFNKKTWITEATYTVIFNNGDHGTVSPSGDQEVGASSGKSITATPQAGYRFSSWSKTGSVTLSSTSTNPTTVRATGTGTVTPSYVRSYAFIEGRLSVYNAARTTETHVASSKGGWDKSSTRIAMEYDGTNHRFYRHTYKTPAELSTQQSGQDQWFAFKTSTSSSSLATPQPFEPATSQSMTTTGSANKKALSAADNDRHIKFNSSATDGYAVIYFDEAGVWYELEHTLKYNANGGTGSAPATAYYLKGTTATAAAANTFTRAGYNFNGWKTGASSGTSYAAGASVTMNSNITLYAQWAAKTYTITLDKQTTAPGYSASGTASVPTVTYNAVLPAITGTMPTTTGAYGFMGFYTEPLGEGERLTDGSGAWIASVAGYTDADKKWIHVDDATLYAYYKTAEITGYTYSTGSSIVAPSTSITVTAVVEPTPATTTHIDWKLRYSNDNPYSPQPSLGTGTTTSSFSTPASPGTYRLEAVLRTGSTANAGTTIDSVVNTFQVAGDHTVTVQYKCGSTTIKAATEVTATPLGWSSDIVAPAIIGYTFSGWEAGEGVTIKTGETTTATTHIQANYAGTLTANYTKKRLIYFYNTLNWSNVYVYFYKNSSYWDDDKGAGTDPSYYSGSYSGKHGQMQPIATGSKIYYFDAEAEAVDASYTYVAFTEKAQDNCWYFYDNNKVVRRWDYQSTTMPMFVPLGDQTAVNMNGNTAKYYSKGYWMNYPENTGYTLKIYGSPYADNSTGATREIPFPYSDDLKMPLKLDVEFNNGGEAWFMIYRNDGVHKGENYNLHQNWNPEQALTSESDKLDLVTSAPGIYTFKLTYHEDGSGYPNYYIDVDFPIAVGDYRILYKDNASWSHGAHAGTWAANAWTLASDVIRKNTGSSAKSDTVSFFIAKNNSPAMKFQKVKSITNAGVVTWEDVASGSITIPSAVVTTPGVYNFIVSQPAGGALISLTKAEPYTGNYYIRTDCAGNTKWDSFRNFDHQMTYSDYAAANSGFTHYFAHWVTNGTNVRFCIANDYSMCISDTLSADYSPVVAGIDGDGNLISGNANIRFMWNENTNKLSRAYIKGSGNITDKFLVLEGDAKMYDENGNSLTGANQDHDKGGTKIGTDNQVILHDDQNFVYERTIKVNPKARGRLSAKYNDVTQYFIGSSGTFADGTTIELLGGDASATQYSMRIVYDFKTNRLVTAYMPDGDIDASMAIHADIMLIREHQNEGQQLRFTKGDISLSEVKTVYGVMRFNRWTLNNKSTAAGHAALPAGEQRSRYERGLYWISFPFDVNLNDVFGFGTYGTHWIIEEYDGAARAREGFWAESPGFWRFITNRTNKVLKAGQGYVLALELDLMKADNDEFWLNDIEQIELFFPSASTVNNITKTDTETTVAAHACTINRPTPDGDRRVKDSHWNIVGVPSYANYSGVLKDASGNDITWQTGSNLPYLYEWNAVDNTYTVQSGKTFGFKSMHAYYVQYNGKIKWSLASATPASAPTRELQEPTEVEFCLKLQQDDKAVDQTFIRMSNDEEVSAAFALGEDLVKELNAGKANIYTLTTALVDGDASIVETAGNTLPMSEQTTSVPVGLQVASEGEYTFAMPDGTDGVGVTLIDRETGIRTSLSGLPYTVTLSKGNYDNRFVLEISPISYVATEIENSEIRDQKSDVRKVLIDGLLYIIHDNKMFDARGARVQ